MLARAPRGKRPRAKGGLPWGALLGGVLAGVLAGGVILSSGVLPPAGAAAEPSSPREARARGGSALPARVRAWARESAPVLVTAPPGPARSAGPPDPVRARLAYERVWHDDLAQHASARKDVAWARVKERELSGALLDHARAQRFDVESVDCREKTCVASLRFPSYEEAARRYEHVLPFYEEGHPCRQGTNVYLPPPHERTQPYRVDFLYTCAD